MQSQFKELHNNYINILYGSKWIHSLCGGNRHLATVDNLYLNECGEMDNALIVFIYNMVSAFIEINEKEDDFAPPSKIVDKYNNNIGLAKAQWKLIVYQIKYGFALELVNYYNHRSCTDKEQLAIATAKELLMLYSHNFWY